MTLRRGKCGRRSAGRWGPRRDGAESWFRRGILLRVALLCLVVAAGTAGAAEKLGATATVSSQDVFVGEAFRFQVQISGSEKPTKPDISGLADFKVEDLGGQQNSSRSVTIVNGHMSQVVRHGYLLNYRLTAKREGNLTIPAITVRTDRGTVHTRPIAIHAKKPMETNNFKLRLKLSRSKCTVGEPITMTVTWYLGQDVRAFNFSLPVLDDDHFVFEDPDIDQKADRQYYRIPLGDEEVIGEKGRGTLDGHPYATITFSKVLIPTRAGVVHIAPATVACDALVGYQKSRHRSPFGSGFDDDFFSGFFSDDFFGRRKGVYNRVVVPSNELTLQIEPLPTAGRPANFAGHVGEYHIETTATPTDVSVGDPITLSIVLSGPDYLGHVGLPPLQRQANLAQDFKIPSEMAAGKVVGDAKVFTQTVRAKRAGVKEIPPIELPYFDTKAGTYRIARSKAIPLHVKSTRVVTAEDAEGREIVSVAARELEAWTRGIAANYRGADLLQDQQRGLETWLRSPLWIGFVTLPPFLYVLLLGSVSVARRRSADPLAARQRKAFVRFRQALGSVRADDHEQILAALQGYLAARLRLQSGAVTFRDVQDPLAEAGIDPGTLEDVKNVFDVCEAGRYSGGAAADAADGIKDRALTLVKKLERRLR